MTRSEEADSWLSESEAARVSGDWERALSCLDAARAVVGDPIPLGLRRVLLLREASRFEEARMAVAALLATHPFCADAHLADGFLRLLVGDWTGGWACREWRWHQPEFRRRIPPAVPVWDGCEAPGRRVRVLQEQGLGDFLQFSRFLPRVRERVGSLVVETPPPLLSLMAGSFNDIEFVASGKPIESDLWIGLMSLPERLSTTPETVPAASGYLRPPVSGVSHVGVTPGTLRVGLAPAGNPRHLNDRFRSIRSADWQALAGIRGVDWFQIQPDVPEACRPPMPMASLGSGPDDFSATARWMASLDLVVTVDTSVAHLAGALGIPVWILLPFAPDWRWGCSGAETPWYRSARLFRQQRPGDWNPVMVAIAEELGRRRQQTHGHRR